ncbi:MAG: histidine phosphatase family protein [Pirellulaceae bacterium]|nr:histidine phosphatase family protein [Pirellulaceae bacterium]
MNHLVLLRHGESVINAINRRQRVYCGQFETPLTERGREQAREAGKLLAARTELRFAAVVCSCHQRSQETAALAIAQLPYEVATLPPQGALNERSLGEFEGRAETELITEFPRYWQDPAFSQFHNHLEQHAPRGENLLQVCDRAWPAIQRLLAEVPGDLLVVSHFNTIRCIVARALALPDEAILDLRIQNAQPIVFRRGAKLQLLDGTIS